MLDNRNSGLDPSFIDQAWEDMRKQLDEAMPVASDPERRAFAWWWAAVLLLLLGIGIGWLSRMQTIDLQALPIPAQSTPVATNQAHTPAAARISPSTDQKMRPSTTTATIPRKPAASKNRSATPNDLEKRQPLADRRTALTTAEIKRQKTVSQETEPPAAFTPETLSPSMSTPSVALAPIEREIVARVSALPSLPAAAIPISPLTAEMVVQTNLSTSHYAIELGTSTRSFSTLDGYSIALTKEWQKRGSRWSFGTGLQYRQQVIPFSNEDLPKVGAASAVASMESPNMEESLGSNAVFDFSNGVARFAYGDSTISVPITSLHLIQKLHYLEWPVYANYRFGRKWEASASLRLSYLASAYLDHSTQRRSNETADFAFGGNQGGGTANPNGGYYQLNQQSSTRIGQNTGDFHRGMLSGALGITYYPAPQLGWRIQYSTTPTSLYKLASIERKDHWFGTSLIWRFGAR